MSDNLVWYVCYGSNLDASRFGCYIVGGVAAGSTGAPKPGCADKTPPRQTAPFHLPHLLYFAKSSKAWNGGAVAFVESRPSAVPTLARAYLLSFRQFTDVAMQENGCSVGLYFGESQEEIVMREQTTFLNFADPHKPSPMATWYGRILNLGEFSGHRALTITASWGDGSQPTSRPDPAYLKTIARGLAQSHALTKQDIVLYLSRVVGLRDHMSAEELSTMLADELL